MSHQRIDGATTRLTAAAVLAAVLAFSLVVLGSTVRVTGSGMGCRSWPLCNGQVGVAGPLPAVLEEAHRYLAALVTLVVAGVAALAWRERRAGAGHARAARLALASLGAVVVQVVLGAVTVFTRNAPVTVALHVLTGLGVLALCAATAAQCVRASRPSGGDCAEPAVRRGAALAVAALAAVLVAGALVVDGGAEAACRAWPLCPSGAPARLVVLQLLHRATVAVAAAVVLWWAYRIAAAVRRGTVRSRRAWQLGAVAVVALLALQVVAGALSAVLAAQAAVADVHLGLGAALWSAVVVLATAATDRSRPAGRSDGAGSPVPVQAATLPAGSGRGT
jgi:heme A synthase